MHKKNITKVIEYIENHLFEDINIEILASIACMSQYHFHRVFSRKTGEKVIDYIKRRRLTHASFELLDTDKTIYQIALDSNYNSHEAFTRAFKKIFNSTPAKYREQNKYRVGSIKCPINATSIFNDKTTSIKTIGELNLIGFDIVITTGDDDNEFIERSKVADKLHAAIHAAEVTYEIDHVYNIYTYLEYKDNEPIKYKIFLGIIDYGDITKSKGIKKFKIPEKKYLIFNHKGGIDKINGSYEKLHDKILTQIDDKVDYSYTLEIIPTEGNIFNSNFEFDIYIPLKT